MGDFVSQPHDSLISDVYMMWIVLQIPLQFQAQ